MFTSLGGSGKMYLMPHTDSALVLPPMIIVSYLEIVYFFKRLTSCFLLDESVGFAEKQIRMMLIT